MEKETIEALERLFTLKERGAIDDAEYARLKDELLSPADVKKSIVVELPDVENSPVAIVSIPEEVESSPQTSPEGLTEVRWWTLKTGKKWISKEVAVQSYIRVRESIKNKEAAAIVKATSAENPHIDNLERASALAFAAKLQSLGAIVELVPPATYEELHPSVAPASEAPSQARAKSGTPEWLKSDREKIKEANTGLLCPHCQIRGKISRKEIKKKKGISASKLIAAPLTGGNSLFVVGLSRKDTYTQLTCGSCKMVWVVES
jgi:hypothetical protein